MSKEALTLTVFENKHNRWCTSVHKGTGNEPGDLLTAAGGWLEYDKAIEYGVEALARAILRRAEAEAAA